LKMHATHRHLSNDAVARMKIGTHAQGHGARPGETVVIISI
jgi:hypothetical protein